MYRTLLANFDGAQRNMKNSSEDLNNALAEVPPGLPYDEERSRINSVAAAYEGAREEFLLAVAKLNEFMVGEIISSRSTIRESATYR